MPQVPREQASMLPAALPNVRVSPVATPQTFGAGIADVGQDLGLAIYAKARREADETALTIASRRLSEAQVSLQVEIGNLHGRDAFGGERDSNGVSTSRDALELLNDEWRKAVDHIELSEIHNDTQRREFKRAVSKRYEQLNEFTQFHMNKERVKFQDDETDAYLKSSQDNARLNAADPDIVQTEKLRQRNTLMQWAERHGLGKWVEGTAAGPGEPTSNPQSHYWVNTLTPGEVDEGRIAEENAVRGPGMFVEGSRPGGRTFQGTPEFEQKWREVVSRTNTEVIKGMLYTGADRDAERYYKQNKPDFTAADRDGIERVIEEGSYRGRALRLSRLMTEPGMDRKDALQLLDTIEDPKLHQLARELVMQRFGDQDVADEKDAQKVADRRARTIIDARFSRKEALEHIDTISDPRVQKLTREKVIQHFGDEEVADLKGAEAGAAKRARDVISGKMDRAAALEYVDAIEDPKLQKLTRELVQQHFADQELAAKKTHEQLFDSSKELVDRAIAGTPGKEVNPRLVVGPDAWIALTPAEQASLNHIAREALHPTDRPNDDNAWFKFHSVLTHEQVAALSPSEYRTQYRDRFSNSIRGVADTYYNAIRNAAEKKEQKDPHLSETQTFKDQVEDSFRTSGLLGSVNEPTSKWTEAERSMYVKYERQAAAAIEQAELSKGKKLTPSEKQVLIDGVKDHAIKKLWVRRGFFGFENEVPLIGLEENEKGQAIVPVDQIPDAELTELRNYIISKGRTVTIDKLRRAYAQQVLRNRKAFDAIVNE